MTMVLVVCLVSNLFSCSKFRSEMVSDFSSVPPQYESISVHTKDGEVHTFKHGVVVGEKFIGQDEKGSTTEIAISDIAYYTFTIKERDVGKTVLATVGIVLGAGLLAVGIIALVASCPHVYSYDGESWVLEAEPNGGAITKTTEYVDYSILSRLKPSKEGICKVRIEDNLDEVDFNNEIKLLVIDHNPGTEIIPDVHGNVLTIPGIARPYYAMTDSDIDLLQEYSVNGKLFWDGDIQKRNYDKKHPRDEIHLKFNRPEGARRGVLVFEGSSTFWSTFIMADFLSRFGKSATKRLKRLENDPEGREKVERFMEKSGYYIEVQVKSGTDWVRAGHFKTAGTYVSKIQALQIDLPDSTAEIVEVKLRYAPLFWNIMDIGMSFNYRSEELQAVELAPIEAVDAKQGDIRDLLMEQDDLYYRAERGDRAELSFQVPPYKSSLERTLILKTSGYYNFVLDEEKEMPLLSKVWQAVKRQGIDSYSLERFREIRHQADF